VAIVAATGLLVWLTLQLPSFAMPDELRKANTAELRKSRPAALAGGAMKPPPAAPPEACSPVANEPPVGPGARSPEALPLRCGAIPGDAGAGSVQVVKTTAGKEMKLSAEGSRKLKPSAAERPARRRAASAELEPVYPDPESPAPKTAPAPPIAEGEIFNRPSASPN
jgi:hypothetical protein